MTSVQGSSGAAVSSIGRMAGKFGEVANLSMAIAAAVEEQDAATREIAQSVSVAASSTDQAVLSVQGVMTAAMDTRSEAERMMRSSGAVSDATLQLSNSVEDFIRTIGEDLQERRKAVRQTTNLRSKVTKADGQVIHTMLTDVSLTGAKLRPIEGLHAGEAIAIDFGEGSIKATVAWCEGHAAGIAFKEVLEELPTGVAADQAA
jgi:hypothetical protein